MALKTEQLLALKQLPSIGDAKVFAMANYAIDMSIDGIKDLLDFVNGCISKKIIKGLKKEYQNGFDIDDMQSASNIATSIIGRSEDAGIKVVSYYDDLFPEALKTIKTEKGKSESPLLLYYKGNLQRLELHRGIAIIGTREPTGSGSNGTGLDMEQECRNRKKEKVEDSNCNRSKLISNLKALR